MVGRVWGKRTQDFTIHTTCDYTPYPVNTPDDGAPSLTMTALTPSRGARALTAAMMISLIIAATAFGAGERQLHWRHAALVVRLRGVCGLEVQRARARARVVDQVRRRISLPAQHVSSSAQHTYPTHHTHTTHIHPFTSHKRARARARAQRVSRAHLTRRTPAPASWAACRARRPRPPPRRRRASAVSAPQATS